MTKISTKEMTTDFIEKAVAIYREQYDFSKTKVFSMSSPVAAYCNIHKKFFRVDQASFFLDGKIHELCPICFEKTKEELRIKEIEGKKKEAKASIITKTTLKKQKKEFESLINKINQRLEVIESQERIRQAEIKELKAQKKRMAFFEKIWAYYGYRYDLSQTENNGREVSTIVICPTHGPFKITPRALLQGYHNKPPHACTICNDHPYEWLNKQEKTRKAPVIEFWNIPDYMSMTKPPVPPRPYPHPLEYYKEKAKEVHGEEFDYSHVTLGRNNTGNVLMRNIICGNQHTFTTRADIHISQKCGCPKCNNPFGNDSLPYERCDNYINKIINKYGPDKFDFSEVNYIDRRRKVWVKCNEHDEWFFTNIEDLGRATRSGGCKYCTQSSGEIKVSKYLHEHGFLFEEQYQIVNPRLDILKQEYIVPDFWLPCYNLIIEFNGKQHYKNVRLFQSKDRTFGIQKLRDQVLREYCSLNNINLLEIRYNEINEVGRLIADKIKEISNKKQITI